MALQQYFQACKYVSRNKVYMTQSSNNRQGKSPAEEFAPLATTFRRRLLAGVGSASLVAVGANFGGLTSFLLGLVPESGRSLKLDVLYPIEGYSRRIENNEGFEFIYPASWVGDQRLLYRAAERLERSLDPLPTNSPKSGNRPRKNVNEPIVAYGPPGSSGELNVSVIVSPVPLDFSIETFGGPKEVGEVVVKTITGQRSDVKGTLIESTMREDPKMNVKYYELEFKVESPSFKRHNVAVCCARGGKT
ncbi:psbP domain-containing protein 7, chloroplastic isoform X2 [Gossypium raimondii]|uniref:PsbP C-terminal domain-containing protein n=1 Tax=Gossypium raimondii TaxID=29730 RepID=A0A0D2ST76_GOSRA|nr:psbP domain-containing protein 7, chloroplastic isoform X2 [Gossypium raimondii]KJB45276.1 hypothetical protein B456_007G298700 [Gossypium raimondii]